MDDGIVSSYSLLDNILGGGFRRGWITEFYGFDWGTMLEFMHRILYHLQYIYPDYKFLLIYNQLFGGLDPYKLYPQSGGYGLRISRSFANKDIIEVLETHSNIDVDFLIIVDPYLHILHQYGLENYKINLIVDKLRRLLTTDSAIILFNRENARNQLPFGGYILHHLVHIMIRVKKPDNYDDLILLERVKHPSLPYKSICISIKTLREGFKTF
jgi:hypothetical protein